MVIGQYENLDELDLDTLMVIQSRTFMEDGHLSIKILREALRRCGYTNSPMESMASVIWIASMELIMRLKTKENEEKT